MSSSLPISIPNYGNAIYNNPLNMTSNENHDSTDSFKFEELFAESDDDLYVSANSDIDNAISTIGIESTIDAPKTIERLEQISNESAERRKAGENDDDDEDIDRITIGDSVKLEMADINDLNRTMTLNPPVLDDIEFIS